MHVHSKNDIHKYATANHKKSPDPATDSYVSTQFIKEMYQSPLSLILPPAP